MSPVATGVDAQGFVVVSTRETASKTKNLRARPYASLVVLSDSFYGDWVQVEGPVEIVSLPEAMEGLVDYYRSLSGEHPETVQQTNRNGLRLSGVRDVDRRHDSRPAGVGDE